MGFVSAPRAIRSCLQALRHPICINAEPNVTLGCVSRQSRVVLHGFVLYASPNGIVSGDVAGNAQVTAQKRIRLQLWCTMFNHGTIGWLKYLRSFAIAWC